MVSKEVRLGVGEECIALGGDGEGERAFDWPKRGGGVGTEEPVSPVLGGEDGLEEGSLTGRLA